MTVQCSTIHDTQHSKKDNIRTYSIKYSVHFPLCCIVYGQAMVIDNAFLDSLSVIWYESLKNQWKKALIIDTCFTELSVFCFLP